MIQFATFFVSNIVLTFDHTCYPMIHCGVCFPALLNSIFIEYWAAWRHLVISDLTYSIYLSCTWTVFWQPQCHCHCTRFHSSSIVASSLPSVVVTQSAWLHQSVNISCCHWVWECEFRILSAYSLVPSSDQFMRVSWVLVFDIPKILTLSQCLAS